jgi:hypothetical protein
MHIFNNTVTAFISQLLSLCEAESISYLDEVASSTESLELSKSVALEVSFRQMAII